jgi:hypothetical protein
LDEVYRSLSSSLCSFLHSLVTSSLFVSNTGVDSASNRNEYQVYFLGGKDGWCVALTTLPSSCADSLEIWAPQPPGTLRAYPGLYWDFFTFLLVVKHVRELKVGKLM